MKRVFLLMIACCLFAAKGYSQQEQANPNAPEITFAETVHDFGTVPLNGVAEWEFTFTNTGKEPLIVQNCSSSCGCTAPTCPKDKPVLPGEKGTIKVKYTTTHVEGGFDKFVTVLSNAKNSSVRISIKGIVERPAEQLK